MRHCIAATSLALAIACAYADDQPAGEDYARPRDTLAEQSRRLEQQEKELAQQRQLLEQMSAQLRALQTQLSAPPPRRTSEQPAASPPATVGTQVESAAPARTADISPVLEHPGVLTPKGHWTLEPSLQYTYASKNQVSILGVSILPAITVGLIDIERVSEKTLIGALTARYGLTSRAELEVRLPYVWSNQSTEARPFGATANADTVVGTNGAGIGDVEVAGRYQFNEAGGAWPYVIGELRVKTRTGNGPFDVQRDPATGLATQLPTGSGFWAAQAGATAIYPSDPAVFFGGVNYLYNLPRDVGSFGRIDPGNSIGVNFGMGVSLNDYASFSIGYEHSWLGNITQNGITLPSSTGLQVGRLLVGYSYRLSDRATLNLSLGIGVTDAAPNSQITVRLPWSF